MDGSGFSMSAAGRTSRVCATKFFACMALKCVSTLYSSQAPDEVAQRDYDLVLIDVESDVRVQSAQELCDEIKKVVPQQHVAFVCNYRVAIESDCPDEIIRAEFNPEALVRGVQQALGKNEEDDKARDLPIA